MVVEVTNIVADEVHKITFVPAFADTIADSHNVLIWLSMRIASGIGNEHVK